MEISTSLKHPTRARNRCRRCSGLPFTDFSMLLLYMYVSQLEKVITEYNNLSESVPRLVGRLVPCFYNLPRYSPTSTIGTHPPNRSHRSANGRQVPLPLGVRSLELRAIWVEMELVMPPPHLCPISASGQSFGTCSSVARRASAQLHRPRGRPSRDKVSVPNSLPGNLD